MRRMQDQPGYRTRLSESGYRGYVRYWSESAVMPGYLDIVRRAAARRGHRGVESALSVKDSA